MVDALIVLHFENLTFNVFERHICFIILQSVYNYVGTFVQVTNWSLSQVIILLGEEHPDTILAMSGLAATYEGLGKYADAEKLQIQVLNMRNRLLGEEHPHTLTAMENLAKTYHHLKKVKYAEQLEIQVADTRRRIFGEGHPDTIKAVASLAAIRFQANANTSGAEPRKTGKSWLL